MVRVKAGEVDSGQMVKGPIWLLKEFELDSVGNKEIFNSML